MAQDISFGISGENAEFMRALKESQQAAVAASEQMKSSFESISSVFQGVTGALGVFSAALAGGAAFREAISTTVELTTGALALGRQFGISATQASELRVALDDIHVSQETFQTAGNALTKTLNTNEEAFKNAGVATRTSSGEYRNQLDILLDTTDHLAKLKEGTDRNVEGQRLFGKAWAEVAPIVKLTSDRMREAAEKAEALGLTVGTEQVTAVGRYRSAMNDVGDVLTAIKNVIGQTVMPALTAMGEWFGSIGPGVVQGFRIALAALAVPFRAIALGFEIIWQTGKAVFTQLAEYATTFALMFNKALHGDFAGAGQAWRDGMGRIEQIGNDYWEKIAKDAADTQKKIVDSFAEAIVGPKVTPTKAGDGGAAAESEAQMKRAMELLREQMRLEDQHAQLKIKQIEYDLEESDRVLSGEQRSQAAEQRHINLLKEKISLLNREEQLRLKGIQTGLEESGRFLKEQERQAQELQQKWSTVTNAISSGMASSFRGMASGAMSFGQAMRNMFASIAEAALQQAAQNIATMVMQAAVGGGIRSAEIKKDAGAAAAATYKSVASIPYVGWIIAPISAAAAYAAVLAFDSAEGGYDIPAGVNPVVQTHSREMILPEEHADTIRNLGGRGRGQTHTIRAQPIGGGRAIIYHDELADAIRKLGHQFKLG